MPGLIRGVARTAVIAGTATAVSNNVSRRQARRWGADDQAQPEAQAAPASAGTEDVAAQLEKLADLKAKGVLTDEEFAAQKAKLLG